MFKHEHIRKGFEYRHIPVPPLKAAGDKAIPKDVPTYSLY